MVYSRGMDIKADSILGFNDEQTTCDRCGRVELRGTVVLAHAGVETARVGTSCASRILGRPVTRKVAVTTEMVRREHARGIVRDIAAAREAGDMQGWRVLLNDFARVAVRADELVYLNRQRAEFIPAWRAYCAEVVG